MTKIDAKELTRLFGPNQEEALRRLAAGEDRNSIRDRLGTVVAVDRVSFEVSEGELFVLMGLSGSGKSTLLRCVNRLIEPSAGELKVDGEDVKKLSPVGLRNLRRHKIGMVFQGFGLFSHRTVLGNVEYGLEIQGVSKQERRDRALSALSLVGLEGWESNLPQQLSGGMQQRVGLARALANDPDILLMDEAFSALDPLIRREMQDELLELQGKMKKTILFVTHDLNEALRLGERIGIMRDGRLAQVGTPEEILSDPADEYVASFVSDVDRSRVLTAGSVMRSAGVLRLQHAGPQVALREMRERGVSTLFTVDSQGRPSGVIALEAAIEAVKAREKTLDDRLLPEPPQVSPDTPLHDLLGLAAEHILPLPVVNEDGRLLGVLPRAVVLGALSGNGNGNGNGNGTGHANGENGNNTNSLNSQLDKLLAGGTQEGNEKS